MQLSVISESEDNKQFIIYATSILQRYPATNLKKGNEVSADEDTLAK
jgi:hypothetical protein